MRIRKGSDGNKKSSKKKESKNYAKRDAKKDPKKDGKPGLGRMNSFNKLDIVNKQKEMQAQIRTKELQSDKKKRELRKSSTMPGLKSSSKQEEPPRPRKKGPRTLMNSELMGPGGAAGQASITMTSKVVNGSIRRTYTIDVFSEEVKKTRKRKPKQSSNASSDADSGRLPSVAAKPRYTRSHAATGSAPNLKRPPVGASSTRVARAPGSRAPRRAASEMVADSLATALYDAMSEVSGPAASRRAAKTAAIVDTNGMGIDSLAGRYTKGSKKKENEKSTSRLAKSSSKSTVSKASAKSGPSTDSKSAKGDSSSAGASNTCPKAVVASEAESAYAPAASSEAGSSASTVRQKVRQILPPLGAPATHFEPGGRLPKGVSYVHPVLLEHKVYAGTGPVPDMNNMGSSRSDEFLTGGPETSVPGQAIVKGRTSAYPSCLIPNATCPLPASYRKFDKDFLYFPVLINFPFSKQNTFSHRQVFPLPPNSGLSRRVTEIACLETDTVKTEGKKWLPSQMLGVDIAPPSPMERLLSFLHFSTKGGRKK